MKCKHTPAKMLTAGDGGLVPMPRWWWCSDCGATRLDTFTLRAGGSGPVWEVGKWKSPKFASRVERLKVTKRGSNEAHCVCCKVVVEEMPTLCSDCFPSFTDHGVDGAWCDRHEPEAHDA